jgi:SagB-type dehydrogenase family enzyme
VSERYRRSPHLICFWEGPRLVLQNYAAGTRVSASPQACQLLHFFDRWRAAGELAASFPEISAESLGRAVTNLIRARLLDYSSAPRDPREKALSEWKDWSPAALYFHLSTKDAMSPIEPEDSVRALRRRARITPMPSPCKRYRGAKQVRLPALETGGEFERVLHARRTSRKFAKSPVSLAQISRLLGNSFGVQWWLDLKGMGRVALKTSPSGGSRHPIEAYVAALRVDGLPRGLYHYDSAAHRLALLRKGSSAKEVTRHLNGQWWFGGAASVVYMTAVFARTQWKYPTSRAYRVILADAAHACSTFCLTATAHGLAPFCTMALADSDIEKSLGIDGLSESIMYVAGVGVPEKNAGWAAWPTLSYGQRIPNPALAPAKPARPRSGASF